MGLRIDLMYGLEAAVMRCGSKLCTTMLPPPIGWSTPLSYTYRALRAVLPPDADAEGVGRPEVAVSSPQHELVGVAVGVCCPIDQPAALELGVRASSG
jgi:hypothetical protein